MLNQISTKETKRNVHGATYFHPFLPGKKEASARYYCKAGLTNLNPENALNFD
jgi:hypothetical protein